MIFYNVETVNKDKFCFSKFCFSKCALYCYNSGGPPTPSLPLVVL